MQIDECQSRARLLVDLYASRVCLGVFAHVAGRAFFGLSRVWTVEASTAGANIR